VKVVIAPDSFKESLSAADAAAALAEGTLQACGEAVIDVCPMADGGEGTVAAMVAATGGRFVTVDVFGPLGSPLRARFGLLGTAAPAALPGQLGLSAALGRTEGEAGSEHAGAQTAVIETAAASGLALVPPELRDPMRTTTFGTGQLILAALDAGAADILVGIGGSATVDGGCGCAQALGVTFIDAEGQACVCGLAGGGLTALADIDLSGRDPRVEEACIRVATDVSNPLTGPEGAAAVFAPQKGATPEMVERLEAGLAHLADLIRKKFGLEVSDLPGAGAAGGLGAGLVAFAGAELAPGVETIAEAVGLPRRLGGADLCLTGEGTLDGSSRFGKAAVGVAKLANLRGVPTICIPGQAHDDAPADIFAGVCPLVADEVTVRLAMEHPQEFLRIRAAEAVRAFARQ
jgi:glycerate kinase